MRSVDSSSRVAATGQGNQCMREPSAPWPGKCPRDDGRGSCPPRPLQRWSGSRGGALAAPRGTPHRSAGQASHREAGALCQKRREEKSRGLWVCTAAPHPEVPQPHANLRDPLAGTVQGASALLGHRPRRSCLRAPNREADSKASVGCTTSLGLQGFATESSKVRRFIWLPRIDNCSRAVTEQVRSAQGKNSFLGRAPLMNVPDIPVRCCPYQPLRMEISRARMVFALERL